MTDNRDIEQVRSLLDTPPPNAAELHRARTRLADHMEARGSRRRHRLGSGFRFASSRRWLPSLRLAGGLVAASALAAGLLIAVALGPSGTKGPSGGPGGSLRIESARAALVEAGRSAGEVGEWRAPLAGDLWYVATLGIENNTAQGPNFRFDAFGVASSESWRAADGSGISKYSPRLATYFAWPEDRAHWLELWKGEIPEFEGYEMHFRRWRTEEAWRLQADGRRVPENRRAVLHPANEDEMVDHARRYQDAGFTRAQLAELPTDEEALRTVLREHAEDEIAQGRREEERSRAELRKRIEREQARARSEDGPTAPAMSMPPASTPPTPEQVMAEHAVRLVAESPVSPEVRQALFNVLADLEGVRLIGAGHDLLGRRGVRIQFSIAIGQLEVLLDPDAGQVLATAFLQGSEADDASVSAVAGEKAGSLTIYLASRNLGSSAERPADVDRLISRLDEDGEVAEALRNIKPVRPEDDCVPTSDCMGPPPLGPKVSRPGAVE